MRIVFAGTPEFARVALQALIDAGHDIPLVLTQPDRPAGRGMKLQASPVKQCALEHGITVLQPRSLRLDGKFPEDAAAAREALVAARPDAMVVAAYGLILPQWVLDLPRFGCLNIHASLLPRWRGAAPIHRAIEAGDAETGVTIMQMDAGLDTGAMLLAEKLPIEADETTGSLHDKLAALGARLIKEALAKVERGELQAVPQPAEGVNYAPKVEKSEAQIDWSQDAARIARRVRAFDPAPGATTLVQGPNGVETLKIWRAHAQSTHSSKLPGTVLTSEGDVLRVQCGQGVLCITELQRAGGKRLAAADFLRGDKSAVLAAGTVLGQAT